MSLAPPINPFPQVPLDENWPPKRPVSFEHDVQTEIAARGHLAWAGPDACLACERMMMDLRITYDNRSARGLDNWPTRPFHVPAAGRRPGGILHAGEGSSNALHRAAQGTLLSGPLY
jgi:hypothetical protein